MYKSINIGDFVLSVDCLQRKTPKRSLFSTFTSSQEIEKETVIDMNSERERIFYYPLVNNCSVHIRCMFSLWEGLINSAMSGSSSDLSSKSESKSMNWGLSGCAD